MLNTINHSICNFSQLNKKISSVLTVIFWILLSVKNVHHLGHRDFPSHNGIIFGTTVLCTNRLYFIFSTPHTQASSADSICNEDHSGHLQRHCLRPRCILAGLSWSSHWFLTAVKPLGCLISEPWSMVMARPGHWAAVRVNIKHSGQCMHRKHDIS